MRPLWRSGVVVLVLAQPGLLSIALTEAQTLPPDLSRTEISADFVDYSTGGNPDYRVTFRAGKADFQCLDTCAVPGIEQAPYSREEFSALVAAFQEAGFFELAAEQDGRCVDCGLTILRYRDERRSHAVRVSGAARHIPKLAALMTRVSEAADRFKGFLEPSVENYRALLAMGRDPNQPLDPSGDTMLNYAVRGIDSDAVPFLLARGARVNTRALEHASMPSTLEPLWRSAQVSAASEQARSLLMNAASGNWTENISWLVAHGVDVNVVDPATGTTPLMAAAQSGYERSLTLLLSVGARPEQRDADGNQALWFAAGRDINPSLIPLLLKQGLQVDDVNRDGRTPLMHAAESCAAANVRELIAAGAVADRKDKSGKTAVDFVPAAPAGSDWRARQCQTARTLLGGKSSR